MKKIINILFIAISCSLLSSCFEESQWDQFDEWRKTQDEWLQTELAKKDAAGKPYYMTVPASFNKNAVVYLHFHNNTEETKNNLVPLYTSTVDMKYHGRIFTNEAFDSSYLSTSPADSVVRFNAQEDNLITGWVIALMNMHVGDSVTAIIPWNVAYGESGTGDIIRPYTHLIFDMKLVDIPMYETRP